MEEGIQEIKESCMGRGNDMADYQVRPSEVVVVLYGLQDNLLLEISENK
jgi:hypothetical protein